MNVGSVFSGIGLLDYGLHLAGLQHSWFCERDEWRRGILAQRWPGARVLDDVRRVGGDLPRVDVIAGGFPCKGASSAGKREGFGHPETVLWREMARAVRELRPRYVIVENVAAILALHDGAVWGEVLGDLASLGFGVEWDVFPAAAFGAPHLRERVVAVASHAESRSARRHPAQASGRLEAKPHGGGCVAPYAAGSGGQGARPGRQALGRTAPGRGVAHAPVDALGDSLREQPEPEPGSGCPAVAGRPRGVAVEWGVYEPAIRRWEAVHGPAPEPLVRRVDDGDRALQRVRSRVDRSRLSALGDGVHVYLGRIAGEYIMSLERERLQEQAA